MPLYESEKGLALRFRFIRDGDVADISGAVVKQIWVLKPGASAWVELTASFTDAGGVDGIIQHVFTAAEMDTPGVWQGAGYLELPTWSKWGRDQFLVQRNMPT